MTVEAGLDFEQLFQDFLKSEKHRELIRQMAASERRSLTVDFLDLSVYDSRIANALLENPDEYLQQASRALQSQLKIEAPDYYEEIRQADRKLHVRLKGLIHRVPLRTLGSRHIDRLIAVDGIVVRATPVKPLILDATFKCNACNAETRVPQSPYSTFLRAPKRCGNRSCGRATGFELLPEKSRFIDCQEMKIQERPEDLPPGQLPRAVEAFAVDDIVDIARPGDRVTLTGVVRAKPEVIPGKGRLRIFNLFIEVNNIEAVGKEREDLDISPEDEKRILEMAKREFIYQDLVNSIAPSIYGNEDIKEAILYLLVGGVPKTTSEGIPIRGDLHVLVVGDPGTAKSQLLRHVAKIAPRGVYTSGRGTTAAGLTAAVVREKAGSMALEAGALVLADKGVAAVDEIDKMRDEDRVAMHEMMEQQTISVAKGGIVATLNARASILAAANPKFGRYEDRLTVAENIDIPIVILSRFDLIFIEKDRPQRSLDDRLSEHILAVHKTGTESTPPVIPPDLLRKYVMYARSRVKPKLSEEAVGRLKEFYLKMREISEASEESPVAITPRQLEALIRIAEARAKAGLRDTVTAMDAEAAIKIMQKSLQDVGVIGGPEGIDIDVIMTGKPMSVREGLVTVLRLLGEIERREGEVEVEELLRRLEAEYKMDRRRAEEYLRILERDGEVFSPRDGYLKRAR